MLSPANRQLFDVANISFSFWWMCSCKVFDTIDSSSIIISFKSDSASLICVFFWSDIGVILSPYSLGIAYQEKKQLQDKTIIACKLRQMQAKKKSLFPTENPGECKYVSSFKFVSHSNALLRFWKHEMILHEIILEWGNANFN